MLVTLKIQTTLNASNVYAHAPELHRSLVKLANWMRAHTSATGPDSPHDILVDAVQVLQSIDPSYPRN